MDHVASVRQARRAVQPDPVQAAVLAELGGADGITVHLREDRRHIQDRDVEILRQTVKTQLNVELAATQEMLRFALTIKPDQVTLVPERRDEVTTEGGIDVVLNSVPLKPIVKTLREGGIRVSVFVDPDLEQIKAAHKLDAHAVELNTATYADAADASTALRRISDAARLGRKLGLAIHAGHSLAYKNVEPIAAIAEISALNIGHSIIARSVLVGIERAVAEMAGAIRGARGSWQD
jgi:pyridoxine 5-phosphate synthase